VVLSSQAAQSLADYVKLLIDESSSDKAKQAKLEASGAGLKATAGTRHLASRPTSKSDLQIRPRKAAPPRWLTPAMCCPHHSFPSRAESIGEALKRLTSSATTAQADQESVEAARVALNDAGKRLAALAKAIAGQSKNILPPPS
jgi:hypothetical protein